MSRRGHQLPSNAVVPSYLRTSYLCPCSPAYQRGNINFFVVFVPLPSWNVLPTCHCTLPLHLCLRGRDCCKCRPSLTRRQHSDPSFCPPSPNQPLSPALQSAQASTTEACRQSLIRTSILLHFSLSKLLQGTKVRDIDTSYFSDTCDIGGGDHAWQDHCIFR
jgi:hypothetical protein